MKYLKQIFLMIFLNSSAWSAETLMLECSNVSETSKAMNSFNLEGPIEFQDKTLVTAQLTGTIRRAGIDSIVSDAIIFNLAGTSRVYPAKTLGFYEVVLMQLKGEQQSEKNKTLQASPRTVQLTAASGLSGPQSTLTVQGIPFRAECKLK